MAEEQGTEGTQPEGEAPKEEAPKEEAPKEEGSEESASDDDPITKAETASQKLKEENERMEKNIQELRKLAVRDIVGGKSSYTGQQTQEQKDEADAKQILKDTLGY